MIQLHDPFEKNSLEIVRAFNALKIPKLLREANIRKSDGFSVTNLLMQLILLVFEGRNLFRVLESDESEDRPSKDTFYRLLKCPKFAWQRFLSSLATRVIDHFTELTDHNRVKVLIVDDSLFSRARSKKVELLAKVYDHVSGKMVNGFSMLTLGWSDGYSFVPIDFNMLSSRNGKYRLCEVDERIDKRTHGYKRRLDALLTRPESVNEMVKRALSQGIQADYILMDSWFTNEPMLQNMKSQDLDVIGMLKDMNQRYHLNGTWYNLKELRSKLKSSDFNGVIGELHVQTKHGIDVKLVFVKNRNKKKDWLVILSTDCTISASEVVRIYGMRWDIEVFFKASKSFFKLAKEFQGRSYDMTISHTTIVFTRYILLQWLHRESNDLRSLGTIFFETCDEVKRIDFIEALQLILNLLDELKEQVSMKASKLIECLVDKWVQSLPTHIKLLLGDFGCES